MFSTGLILILLEILGFWGLSKEVVKGRYLLYEYQPHGLETYMKEKIFLAPTIDRLRFSSLNQRLLISKNGIWPIRGANWGSDTSSGHMLQL